MKEAILLRESEFDVKEVEFAVREVELALKECEFAVREVDFAMKEREIAMAPVGHCRYYIYSKNFSVKAGAHGIHGNNSKE